jgi:hypothetical protein
LCHLHSFHLGYFRGIRLLLMHPISRTLRLRRRAENRSLVAAQHLEPRRDIGRMIGARLGGQPEVGADKGGRQFSDQFFCSVSVRTEPPGQVARETMRRTRCVRAFMRPHGVCRGGIAEQFEGGKMNAVRLGR